MIEPVLVELLEWRRLDMVYRPAATLVQFQVYGSSTRKRFQATEAYPRAEAQGGQSTRFLVEVANPETSSLVVACCLVQKKPEVIGTATIELQHLLPYNDTHDVTLHLCARRDSSTGTGGGSAAKLGSGQDVCDVHVMVTAFAPRTKAAMKAKSSGSAAKGPQHLFDVLDRGDLFELVQARDAGLDPNVRDSMRDTPLHHAVSMQQDMFAYVLLDYPGIDVGAKNVNGNTPLHLFCKSFAADDARCERVFNKLLAHGAVLDSRNNDGETPLHRAVLNPRVPVVMAQLLLGRSVNVNAVTARGATPLHYAVQMQSAAVVHVLMEHGADMHAEDDHRLTPLGVALQLGDQRMVRLLTDYDELDSVLRQGNILAKRLFFYKKKWFCRYLPQLQPKHLDEAQIDRVLQPRLLGFFASLGARTSAASLTNDPLQPDLAHHHQHQQQQQQQQRASSPERPDAGGRRATVGGEIEGAAGLGAARGGRLTSTAPAQYMPQPCTRSVSEREMPDVGSSHRAGLARPRHVPAPEATGGLSVATIDERLVVLGSILGEGSTGTVYSGMYNGHTVAVKVFVLHDATREQEEETFKRECRINAAVASPYVVKLHGVVFGQALMENKVAMVMELCPRGNLYALLSSPGEEIGWGDALSFMRQIAKGLHALHSHQPAILHRDFKSHNILVTIDPSEPRGLRLKIGDFGLSRTDVSSNFVTLSRVRGTLAYIAPEIISGSGIYTDKSDVYSMGIVFWEIVARCLCREYCQPYFDVPPTESDIVVIRKVAENSLRPSLPPTTPSKVVCGSLSDTSHHTTMLFISFIIVCLWWHRQTSSRSAGTTTRMCGLRASAFS